MKTLAALVVSLLGVAVLAHGAETKNGVSLSVSKKTISRNDTRYAYYFNDLAIDRIMGLLVNVKNVTPRTMPEGEVEYQILVIKSGYLPPNYELYSGKEKLAALKAAQGAELILGSAQVTGWRDASYQRKDKIEYKVTVKIGDEEKVSVVSTNGFDAMAKRARKAKSSE